MCLLECVCVCVRPGVPQDDRLDVRTERPQVEHEPASGFGCSRCHPQRANRCEWFGQCLAKNSSLLFISKIVTIIATRNKCIATSNKGLTSSNKKLFLPLPPPLRLGRAHVDARSQDAVEQRKAEAFAKAKAARRVLGRQRGSKGAVIWGSRHLFRRLELVPFVQKLWHETS